MEQKAAKGDKKAKETLKKWKEEDEKRKREQKAAQDAAHAKALLEAQANGYNTVDEYRQAQAKAARKAAQEAREAKSLAEAKANGFDTAEEHQEAKAKAAHETREANRKARETSEANRKAKSRSDGWSATPTVGPNGRWNCIKCYSTGNNAEECARCGLPRTEGTPANVLRPQTKQVYSEDFAKFDADGDGFLDEGEVKQLLEHQLGRKPTDEELSSYFSELDTDSDGKVSLDEYLKSLVH